MRVKPLCLLCIFLTKRIRSEKSVITRLMEILVLTVAAKAVTVTEEEEVVVVVAEAVMAVAAVLEVAQQCRQPHLEQSKAR